MGGSQAPDRPPETVFLPRWPGRGIDPGRTGDAETDQAICGADETLPMDATQGEPPLKAAGAAMQSPPALRPAIPLGASLPAG